MKKSKILLAAIALALVLCVSIGSALAYFTASKTVKGAVPLNLGAQTIIEEPPVSDGVKTIQISNKSNSDLDVWVRAKAFAGEDDSALVLSGDGWSGGGDGWWYYDTPLKPGDKAADLLVDFKAMYPDIPDDGTLPPELTNFNVVVVHEAIPVVYDEDEPVPAAADDWTKESTIING